jgi:hypothetical protein
MDEQGCPQGPQTLSWNFNLNICHLESGRLGKTPRSCLQVRIGRLHVWDVIDGKSRYCAILQGVTTFAFDKEYVAKLMRCEQLKHK